VISRTKYIYMATKLSNILQSNQSDPSGMNNVVVVVRVRPPNKREVISHQKCVINVVNQKKLIFDPKVDDYENTMSSKHRFSVLEKKVKDIHYLFDRVFDETSTNENIFECSTKSIIDDILKGYNCSVFAYGATSAGKTHTMLGSPEEPGVIFLTMMELYTKMMEKKEDYDTDISVSYLEIYNETCKDLLLPTGPLSLREDPDKKVVVRGLSVHKPRTADELLSMLHYGNVNRTQHPTDANKQSSRSHAVFQVFVKQCPKHAGITADIIYAKMSLIDLAGSERATVTMNSGDRLREGANINKSLLALGNCINALSENKSNIHVPYRDSKLTRLLKDSLGGNCKTVMIAAVSPSFLSYEDTHNTLKYANRAKSIKSSLAANNISVDYHVSQYPKIIEDLKAQIAVLQAKLNVPQEKQDIFNTANVHLLKQFEERLNFSFTEKRNFKKQLIDIEAMEKELSIKLLQKERYYIKRTNLQNIFEAGGGEEDALKLETFRQSLDLKFSKLNEQRTMLRSALVESENSMSSLNNEIDSWANTNGDMMREHVNILYENRSLNLENLSLKCQLKEMRRYFKMQECEHRSIEQYIDELYSVISKQKSDYEILKKQNLACDHTNANGTNQQPANNYCNLFNESKIKWADQTTIFNEEKQNLIGGKNFNVESLLNFKSCTPFKTPLKRPEALRQLVLSSRVKQPSSDQRKDLTEHNTTLNTGPIRMQLNFDQTYAVDQPDILESTYLVDNDFEEKQPLTPVKSNIQLKSHISRRTRLKGKHGEKRRVVSHSDDETARPSQSFLNRTFDVRSNKQFKTGRNVDLPTRAKSSIDLIKENTRPTTAASYKRKLLKLPQGTLCLKYWSFSKATQKF